jgi:hypothetical protein
MHINLSIDVHVCKLTDFFPNVAGSPAHHPSAEKWGVGRIESGHPDLPVARAVRHKGRAEQQVPPV